MRASKHNKLNLKQLIQENSAIQTFLFWLVMGLILTIINKSNVGFLTEFWFELVNVSFFAIIVATNKFILFPRYLKNNSFGIHLVLLLVAALILTPVKGLALYYASANGMIRSYVLENQTFIFISTFLVGAGSSIYFVVNDWVKTQKVKQELKNETLQSELKFLKSQINPHFLFNTLNSLYALTLKKSDLAPEIVLRLSEMMRYMLYECNEKQVPLEKEVNYLSNYLELEKLRHGSRIEVNLKVNGKIENKQIAPLMFIPFIENSFKHGISQNLQKSYVNIDVNVNEEKLDLSIENSKSTAMPGSNPKRSGGIGLVNVKRRLDLLYPSQYALEIKDQPNNYIVNLKLNLIAN